MITPSHLRSRNVLLMGLLFVVLIGCAKTAPSRFYSLSAMSGLSPDGALAATQKEVTLGIGPLKLPDYLDRPQIITYKNQNEISVAEYDRWAGKLSDDLMRVISENLSVLLSTDRIATYPWRGAMPLDYQVEIEILQFDGNPGQRAVLLARWSVIKAKGKEVVAMKRSSITESAAEAGYTGLVAAQSRAVGALSREIASVIRSVSQARE
jgi:uncharacterized protein